MIDDLVLSRVNGRQRIVSSLRAGLLLLLLSMVILMHDLQPAVSAPLKMTECLVNWNDREEARGKGVEKMMAEGPMVALSSMSKPQLQMIRDYLILTENLKFRCPKFTPTPRPNPRR